LESIKTIGSVYNVQTPFTRFKRSHLRTIRYLCSTVQLFAVR